MEKPYEEMTGVSSYEPVVEKHGPLHPSRNKITYAFVWYLNKTLRLFRIGGFIWK